MIKLQAQENVVLNKRRQNLRKFKNNIPLHLMLMPAMVVTIIFSYIPMVGIIMAFQKFIPAKGMFGDQIWVGWKNFELLFSDPAFGKVIRNTVVIALGKIALGTVVPVVFALLLNEVTKKRFKKAVQTIIYFPYFLSWVIFAGILIDILSPSTGVVNIIRQNLGLKAVDFLGDKRYFQITVIVTDVMKCFGYNTVIYLATIAGIDPSLYEAAKMDGANRWQQTWHITLTGMRYIIVLLLILSLGSVLSAGFDQVYSLMKVSVREVGDILDTFIYRRGILSTPPNFSLAAAAGLFKAVIGFILIGGSYYITYKFFDYRLF